MCVLHHAVYNNFKSTLLLFLTHLESMHNVVLKCKEVLEQCQEVTTANYACDLVYNVTNHAVCMGDCTRLSLKIDMESPKTEN